MPKIKSELFKEICRLTDTLSGEITATNLKARLGFAESEKLIAEKALIQVASRQDIDVTVGDEERSYPVQLHNGITSYFSPESAKWIPANRDDLLVYRVNYDWLLSTLMEALEIPLRTVPQVILQDKIWFIGSAWLKKRKTPIIFVRMIVHQNVAESLNSYLQNEHKVDPALILTSSRDIPAYFQLPGHNRIVSMANAIDYTSQTLALKASYLAEKMGASIQQQGFSNGYRNAYINGIDYSFTKLQAEILEILDHSIKHLHKHELMVKTSSSQNEPKSAFRSKGKYHPAWGVIVKYDDGGNYWLDY